MTTSTKSLRALFTLLLVLATGLLLLSSGTASAMPLVGKDGRVHACYKAKGKGRGTLRLVASGKVRCPRKWRKVAWSTSPVPGSRGEAGATSGAGQPGASGVDANATIVELEGKVAQLLTKVEALEGVLAGVTNADLLGAIAVAPAVGALCAQTEGLTDQANALLGSVGGLNA